MHAIYFDYNATTPCDQKVVDKMLPFYNQIFGNPANTFHYQGRRAQSAIENAREQVASSIYADPGEIFFTSGATESNNLAIFGTARLANENKHKKIVTCSIEHKAVLVPCEILSEQGFDIEILPVDKLGRVNVEDATSAINNQTFLVSIQIANNEIGTIQSVADISNIAHAHGALMHTDAAQAVGKIPVNVNELDIDLLSFSGHKIYGPKGIGVLYIRNGRGVIPIEPLQFGGGQEGRIRPGTLNVPGIVGLGEACRIINEELPDERLRITTLRDQLEKNLLDHIPELNINGDRNNRLPNTSSLIFPGIEADVFLINLSEVMLSTGSACSSGAIEPSHVLQAIGLNREDAYSTIRASLGRCTTVDEINRASDYIIEKWRQITLNTF